MPEATSPRVTIAVVPRERFSFVRESLESVFENTTVPFKLVYVDGASPRPVQRYLDEQAAKHAFEIVRTPYYLSPNEARNIGLAHADTEFIVFLDNDAVVAPGWLEPLVRCADETDCAVVGPLNCEKWPLHSIVHFAGGECGIEEITNEAGETERRVIDKITMQGEKVAEVRAQLKRHQTQVAEFHCVMVRRSIFDRIGLFDEGLLNTKENLDFCMTIMDAGGTVWFEPESVITYLNHKPLAWSDIPYYMVRWSDEWTLASLHHLRDKWNLTEDYFFTMRYKNLGWRRRLSIIRPLAKKWPLRKGRNRIEVILAHIDKRINRHIMKRYNGKRQRALETPRQPQVA